MDEHKQYKQYRCVTSWSAGGGVALEALGERDSLGPKAILFPSCRSWAPRLPAGM